MELTRRKTLKASGSTLAVGVIAGCTEENPNPNTNSANETGNEAEPDSESEPTNESENGGESDSEPADENEGESAERSVELVAEAVIDHNHACLHAEFDERTPLEAGEETENKGESDDSTPGFSILTTFGVILALIIAQVGRQRTE
ncbi:hypothetical protein [Natrialba sp. PRR66]|uniref:hypothetical protein n=1 Tax=Natrialba sp. PRR66 TaxID=3098146 RepID=UPI002B1D1382|nr:hypothetical protein [Natrialba sp. PRR66]